MAAYWVFQFLSYLLTNQHFLSVMQMSNQARWAVLQAFNLLKKHQKVLDALVKALGENLALGSLVETIETTMAAQE